MEHKNVTFEISVSSPSFPLFPSTLSRQLTALFAASRAGFAEARSPEYSREENDEEETENWMK